MNLEILAAIIRMPFLSTYFNRSRFIDCVSKSYIQIKFPPLEITTTNKTSYIISIIQSVLSVTVTSIFSDWLTSSLLFCSLYICDTTRMVGRISKTSAQQTSLADTTR